jgi:hypothetical protein
MPDETRRRRSELGFGVRGQNRACRCHLALHEAKRHEPTVVVKDSLPAAQDQRIDHHPELVDKIVPEIN